MLEHILNGGPLMAPLLLCSLVSLAVVYDRWMAFRANRKLDTRRAAGQGDGPPSPRQDRRCDFGVRIGERPDRFGPAGRLAFVSAAQGEERKHRNHANGRRAGNGGLRSPGDWSVVNKRLDVLTTVGTAAPLLGMTGTVTGMIASFSGLAEAGSVSGSGGAVAAGIAEALVTTAVGLIIALSAVIPQSVFQPLE